MRWFSVFEGLGEWHGDFFATRMILESTSDDPAVDADLVDVGALDQNSAGQQTSGKEDAHQLNSLKKRKGTWKLAPALITEALVAKKDVLLPVRRALWKHHAERARTLKSLGQVCQHYVEAASHT